MPITADTVTIAQFLETEANIDSVLAANVNASAECILATPVGQNDQSLVYAELTQYVAGAAGDQQIVGSAAGLNIGTNVIVAANFAAGAVDTAAIADDAITADKLASNAVVADSIVDGSITLAELGAGVSRVQETISVTDYGADITGVVDATSAIQSAINDAVTLKNGIVRFPRGVYRWDGTVTLPDGGDVGEAYKLIIDLGGSRINTAATGTTALLSRTITDVNSAKSQDYPLRISDGTIVQSGTAGNGIFMRAERMGFFNAHNLRIDSLRTAFQLVFSLEHLITNVEAYECLYAYEILSGNNGEITGGTQTNSRSNVGTWINCKAYLNDASAIGWRVSNSGNATFINCVVEGGNRDIGWYFNGIMDATSRSEDCHAKLVNCRYETGNTFTTTTAVIKIDNIQKSHFEINLSSGNWRGDPYFVQLDNVTETTIRIRETSGFDDNTGNAAPWFDNGAGNNILWIFDNNRLPNGERFSNVTRWQGGVLPANATIHETTHLYQEATYFDTVLSGSPNAILANTDTANTALVGSVIQGTLPAGSRVAGATVLGWDAAGDLAEFDAEVTAISRKAGVDDLGTISGSGGTVNFAAGTYDNKEFTAGADISVTFSATDDGAYVLRVRQDGTGSRTVTLSATTTSPPITTLPLNSDAGQLTVFRFEYDSTDNIWHWG